MITITYKIDKEIFGKGVVSEITEKLDKASKKLSYKIVSMPSLFTDGLIEISLNTTDPEDVFQLGHLLGCVCTSYLHSAISAN